ncbi:imidazole glycerol phosphate synthase subunit HisH [Candidatus Methanoplasma termitum]|uniref:HisH protein n=2 Tax=Candidatus Methanoplasma termitum TaxID=1577791 RepID=A0A0A7LAI3_9ARCH|nr:imidazole glycerol phosphate synthase subunit HisH [Candidatus Methanoplasma termitum]
MADYGVGNLHSVKKAFERNGATVIVTANMKDLLDSECIVFPGVGAFDSTMERLLPYRNEIRKRLLSGIPALGICIGVQIMFDSSEEGSSPGIGAFGGKVIKLSSERVPHMGWNSVESSDALMDKIEEKQFYFANSFRGSPDNKKEIVGTTEYDGEVFPSFFRKANTYGTQFHPEKSSDSGLRLIKNFIDFAEDNI